MASTEWQIALLERRIAHIDNERKDSFRICVGSGSNEQDLVGVADIIFPISSAEYGSKLSQTTGPSARSANDLTASNIQPDKVLLYNFSICVSLCDSAYVIDIMEPDDGLGDFFML